MYMSITSSPPPRHDPWMAAITGFPLSSSFCIMDWPVVDMARSCVCVSVCVCVRVCVWGGGGGEGHVYVCVCEGRGGGGGGGGVVPHNTGILTSSSEPALSSQLG